MAPRITSLSRSATAAISRTLASGSKEVARALPDSKGGETPKQLQSYRTEIYTYFTIANGETMLLYSAENWVRIKLTLETAGPVAIGTQQNIQPVLSGRGRLLDTDREYETFLPKGTRIYVISETVNRIAVTIEPVPWLEQLSVEQVSGIAMLQTSIAMMAQQITTAIQGLQGIAPATSSTGLLPHQLPPPCPPGSPMARARLTPMVLPPSMQRPGRR